MSGADNVIKCISKHIEHRNKGHRFGLILPIKVQPHLLIEKCILYTQTTVTNYFVITIVLDTEGTLGHVLSLSQKHLLFNPAYAENTMSLPMRKRYSTV